MTLSRIRPVLAFTVVGVFALAGCGGGDDYSGFESSEECLKAMPLVRPEIQADALGDRCGVSTEMAEIALVAATVSSESASGAQGAEDVDAESSSDASSSNSDGVVDSTSTDAGPDDGDTSSGDGAADAESATAVETTTTTAPATTTTESTIPDGIEVPDVVGMDHQAAQNTMQAYGLRNLAEEDATGEGRRLLWDRNWIVVEQRPEAGTFVDEDTEITLFSVKDDEVGSG